MLSAYHKFQSFLQENRFRKYVGHREAWRNYLATRAAGDHKIPFRSLPAERKRSSTLFILCSGPSLAAVTAQEREEIAKHDTFSINFSFLARHPVTYQLFSYEPDPELIDLLELKIPKHPELRSAVFLLSYKALARYVHPRWCPRIFPRPATYSLFDIPPSIYLRGGETFQRSHFDASLFYRGTLSLALHMAFRDLGYTRAVIVGSDLDSPNHFYDSDPEMAPVLVATDRNLKAKYHDKPVTAYETMLPTKVKAQPFDVYLTELNRYLGEKGQSVMIATKTNVLYPKLPAYFG